jgi:ketosteroid isomerase-like protein
MLEAFGNGELDGSLQTVHPDSRWTYVGANPRPAKGVYVGRDGVTNSFERILRNLTMTTLHRREFVTENDAGVVIGYEAGTVKATGKAFRNGWVRKYVVCDGLITEMEEYNIQVDTTS